MDRATARKIPTSNKKSPQIRAVAVWGLCHAAILLRATESCNRSATPGGCCTVKGFGMLPNKAALYKQRHCLQGFVRTKALLAAEFFHTICAGVCRVIKLPHDRSSTGVRARYRVYKLPVAVDLRWKAPCKGTRTLEQSLVCYTSPGGVDSSGFVRGSRLGRCSGWRSK